MATVSRHGKGWRAQIRRLGFRPLSKTFPTKGRAWAWAESTERALLSGRHADPLKHTLGDALDRYRQDVSPTKRGHRWEKLRLIALARAPIAKRPVGAVSADDVGLWRDQSLRGVHRPKAVSGSTVRREMNLLESVFEVARREWKWVDHNPVKDATKPGSPPARRRRVSEDEVAAVCGKLTGPSGLEVAAGFRLGIETGMRAGEMWALERAQVDLKARVAHLLKTKNGDTRDVSLSPAAVKILRGLLKDGRSAVFSVSAAVRDTLFRKARQAAAIEDLHFHDSRAEAVWRLSKRLDVLELADQIGHRDLKSLLFYFKDSASERAKKLAGRGTRR